MRIRQKRMSNVAESGDEHSKIWGMFMATTSNAATFMGKNFSTIQSVVKNHESLTLKQMFDVAAQLVHNQEEISCLDKIPYGKNSWARLSLINDESSHQSSKHKSRCILRFCVMSRKGSSTSRFQRSLEEQVCRVQTPRKATEMMMLLMESRLNSSGTSSRGFTTLQLCDLINDLLSFLGQTPESFTGRILYAQKCRLCEDIFGKIWCWAKVIQWTRF